MSYALDCPDQHFPRHTSISPVTALELPTNTNKFSIQCSDRSQSLYTTYPEIRHIPSDLLVGIWELIGYSEQNIRTWALVDDHWASVLLSPASYALFAKWYERYQPRIVAKGIGVVDNTEYLEFAQSQLNTAQTGPSTPSTPSISSKLLTPIHSPLTTSLQTTSNSGTNLRQQLTQPSEQFKQLQFYHTKFQQQITTTACINKHRAISLRKCVRTFHLFYYYLFLPKFCTCWYHKAQREYLQSHPSPSTYSPDQPPNQHEQNSGLSKAPQINPISNLFLSKLCSISSPLLPPLPAPSSQAIQATPSRSVHSAIPFLDITSSPAVNHRTHPNQSNPQHQHSNLAFYTLNHGISGDDSLNYVPTTTIPQNATAYAMKYLYYIMNSGRDQELQQEQQQYIFAYKWMDLYSTPSKQLLSMLSPDYWAEFASNHKNSLLPNPTTHHPSVNSPNTPSLSANTAGDDFPEIHPDDDDDDSTFFARMMNASISRNLHKPPKTTHSSKFTSPQATQTSLTSNSTLPTTTSITTSTDLPNASPTANDADQSSLFDSDLATFTHSTNLLLTSQTTFTPDPISLLPPSHSTPNPPNATSSNNAANQRHILHAQAQTDYSNLLDAFPPQSIPWLHIRPQKYTISTPKLHHLSLLSPLFAMFIQLFILIERSMIYPCQHDHIQRHEKLTKNIIKKLEKQSKILSKVQKDMQSGQKTPTPAPTPKTHLKSPPTLDVLPPPPLHSDALGGSTTPAISGKKGKKAKKNAKNARNVKNVVSYNLNGDFDDEIGDLGDLGDIGHLGDDFDRADLKQDQYQQRQQHQQHKQPKRTSFEPCSDDDCDDTDPLSSPHANFDINVGVRTPTLTPNAKSTRKNKSRQIPNSIDDGFILSPSQRQHYRSSPQTSSALSTTTTTTSTINTSPPTPTHTTNTSTLSSHFNNPSMSASKHTTIVYNSQNDSDQQQSRPQTQQQQQQQYLHDLPVLYPLPTNAPAMFTPSLTSLNAVHANLPLNQPSPLIQSHSPPPTVPTDPTTSITSLHSSRTQSNHTPEHSTNHTPNHTLSRQLSRVSFDTADPYDAPQRQPLFANEEDIIIDPDDWVLQSIPHTHHLSHSHIRDDQLIQGFSLTPLEAVSDQTPNAVKSTQVSPKDDNSSKTTEKLAKSPQPCSTTLKPDKTLDTAAEKRSNPLKNDKSGLIPINYDPEIYDFLRLLVSTSRTYDNVYAYFAPDRYRVQNYIEDSQLNQDNPMDTQIDTTPVKPFDKRQYVRRKHLRGTPVPEDVKSSLKQAIIAPFPLFAPIINTAPSNSTNQTPSSGIPSISSTPLLASTPTTSSHPSAHTSTFHSPSLTPTALTPPQTPISPNPPNNGQNDNTRNDLAVEIKHSALALPTSTSTSALRLDIFDDRYDLSTAFIDADSSHSNTHLNPIPHKPSSHSTSSITITHSPSPTTSSSPHSTSQPPLTLNSPPSPDSIDSSTFTLPAPEISTDDDIITKNAQRYTDVFSLTTQSSQYEFKIHTRMIITTFHAQAPVIALQHRYSDEFWKSSHHSSTFQSTLINSTLSSNSKSTTNKFFQSQQCFTKNAILPGLIYATNNSITVCEPFPLRAVRNVATAYPNHSRISTPVDYFARLKTTDPKKAYNQSSHTNSSPSLLNSNHHIHSAASFSSPVPKQQFSTPHTSQLGDNGSATHGKGQLTYALPTPVKEITLMTSLSSQHLLVVGDTSVSFIDTQTGEQLWSLPKKLRHAEPITFAGVVSNSTINSYRESANAGRQSSNSNSGGRLALQDRTPDPFDKKSAQINKGGRGGKKHQPVRAHLVEDSGNEYFAIVDQYDKEHFDALLNGADDDIDVGGGKGLKKKGGRKDKNNAANARSPGNIIGKTFSVAVPHQTSQLDDSLNDLNGSLASLFINTLITASLDGTIKLFDIETSSLLCTMTGQSNKTYTDESNQFYYPDLSTSYHLPSLLPISQSTPSASVLNPHHGQNASSSSSSSSLLLSQLHPSASQQQNHQQQQKRQSYLYSYLGYVYENGATLNAMTKLHKHKYSFRHMHSQWQQQANQQLLSRRSRLNTAIDVTAMRFGMSNQSILPASRLNSFHSQSQFQRDSFNSFSMDESGQLHVNNHDPNGTNPSQNENNAHLMRSNDQPLFLTDNPQPFHPGDYEHASSYASSHDPYESSAQHPTVISVNNDIGQITCAALMSHDILITGSYISNPVSDLQAQSQFKNQPRGAVGVWDLRQGQLVHVFNDNSHENEGRLIPASKRAQNGAEITTHDTMHPSIAAALGHEDEELFELDTDQSISSFSLFVAKQRHRQQQSEQLIKSQEHGIGFATAIANEDNGFKIFTGFSNGILNIYDMRRFDRHLTSIDMHALFPQQNISNYMKYTRALHSSQAKFEQFHTNVLYSVKRTSLLSPAAASPTSTPHSWSELLGNIWVNPYIEKAYSTLPYPALPPSSLPSSPIHNYQGVGNALNNPWATCWDQQQLQQHYLKQQAFYTGTPSTFPFAASTFTSPFTDSNLVTSNGYNENDQFDNNTYNRYKLNPTAFLNLLFHHLGLSDFPLDQHHRGQVGCNGSKIRPFDHQDKFSSSPFSTSDPFQPLSALPRSQTDRNTLETETFYTSPYLRDFEDIFATRSEYDDRSAMYDGIKTARTTEHSSCIDIESESFCDILSSPLANWSHSSTALNDDHFSNLTSIPLQSSLTTHDRYLLNLCHRSKLYFETIHTSCYQSPPSSQSHHDAKRQCYKQHHQNEREQRKAEFAWNHNPILFFSEINLFLHKAERLLHIILSSHTVAVCLEMLLEIGYIYNLSTGLELLWITLQDYCLFYLPHLIFSASNNGVNDPNEVEDHSFFSASSIAQPQQPQKRSTNDGCEAICALHYNSATNQLIALQPRQLSIFHINQAHITHVSSYSPSYLQQLAKIQHDPTSVNPDVNSAANAGNLPQTASISSSSNYFQCLSVSPYDNSIACNAGNKVYLLTNVDSNL